MSDLQTRVQKLLFSWLNKKHLPQGIRPGMAEDLEKFVADELNLAQSQQISERMRAQQIVTEVPPTDENKANAKNS